ncbi:MAG: YhcH/YjgK/YiaL family protein, partial [Muribaculaceae bacterium]|nr:YhcH/YjgK/YiaL family protein [Muribaculaceae bacterium]
MKKFTKEEAQAWVDSRAWAKGLDLKADATIDAVEFAEQYAANPELWDALFAWIKDTDLNTVAAGKHDIVPGRLWVNILEYTPKSAEDTKIESHENFIDLQYTFVGDELMGLAGHVIPTG